MVTERTYEFEKQESYKVYHNLDSLDYIVTVRDEQNNELLAEMVKDYNHVEIRIGMYKFKDGGMTWEPYEDYETVTIQLIA